MSTKSQKAARKIADELSSTYTGTRFRYQFNELNSTHIIEVGSVAVFEDPEYSSKELDIALDFEDNYGETILFISENSLSKIDDSKKVYVAFIEEPSFKSSEEVSKIKPVFNTFREANFLSYFSNGFTECKRLTISLAN